MPERDAARILSRRGAGRWVRRWLVAATALGLLSLPLTPLLANALIPLFVTEIGWLDDTFRIDRLSLAQDGPERVFRVEVHLAHTISVNGHTAAPDPRGAAYASTLIDNVTLPAVILIAVAMSWPAPRPASYAVRAALLIPALLTIWMVDVPLVLLSALWQLIFDAFDPGRFSALLAWSGFLHGGGRVVLATIAGAVVGAASGCHRTAAWRT